MSETTNSGSSESRVTPEHYGPLGWHVDKEAHELDLDAKILVTSHNSRPGMGKTTWAIQFAKALDPHGWSAEEKAFIDPYEYMEAYDNLPAGSVLVLDEIEAVADARRSTSGQNVDLSQAWATKRYRNMITIATLPTTSMLDNRMIELADYRVNIVRRGVAKAFSVKVPDFPPHKVWQEPIDGVIDFPDLPDGDSDKGYLDELKIEFTSADKEWFDTGDVEEIKSRVERETEKRTRNELIRSFYDGTELSQNDISGVVGLSQQQVNRIVNEK